MLYIQWVVLRPSIFLKSQVLPNKVAIGSRLNANEISGNGEPNPTHPPFRNPKLTLMGQTAGLAALSHSLTAPQTTHTVPNFSLLLQQSPSRLLFAKLFSSITLWPGVGGCLCFQHQCRFCRACGGHGIWQAWSPGAHHTGDCECTCVNVTVHKHVQAQVLGARTQLTLVTGCLPWVLAASKALGIAPLSYHL